MGGDEYEVFYVCFGSCLDGLYVCCVIDFLYLFVGVEIFYVGDYCGDVVKCVVLVRWVE